MSEISPHRPKPRILAVEDDADLAELLRINLAPERYEFRHAADGDSGLQEALSGWPDVILLDIALPGMDGYSICRRLRERGNQTPILMLTARTDEIDKVMGLETGADDYLTKPFSVRELQARIKALLRRATVGNADLEAPARTLHFEDLVIDPEALRVTKNGQRLDLTHKEFQLLHTLAQQPGKTWSREQLLRRIWGVEFQGYEHTVNSHINRLRTKLEDQPAHPRFVLTTWGQGYRFTEDV